MKLTDHDISEFIDAWFEEFGERLAAEGARHKAMLLIELYTLIADQVDTSPQHPIA